MAGGSRSDLPCFSHDQVSANLLFPTIVNEREPTLFATELNYATGSIPRPDAHHIPCS